MAKIYTAKLKDEEGKTVFIEIEVPDSTGTSEKDDGASRSTSDGSFSFTDGSGKRLTITIAE